MCLLMLKTEGGHLDRQKLIDAWSNNSDGAGFAYVKDNKVVTEKFMTLNEFLSNVEKVRDKKAIIHFRMATSGVTSTVNVHPFIVGKKDRDVERWVGNMAIAHNGVMQEYVRPGKHSDTFHFVKHFARVHTSWTKDDIEAHIGSYNKLVTLDKYNHHVIYNESVGHWIDGVWYSNTSYNKYKPLYSNSGYKKTGSFYSDDYATPYGDADTYYQANDYFEAPITTYGGTVNVREDLVLVDDRGNVIKLKEGEYMIFDEDEVNEYDEFLCKKSIGCS